MNILIPNEIKATLMALATQQEDLEGALKSNTKWKPDTLKDLKDMLKHTKNAKAIMEKITGGVVNMSEYVEGDEKEFIETEK